MVSAVAAVFVAIGSGGRFLRVSTIVGGKMKITIAALLLLGAPFFFLGGPGAHGSRSFVALWDLGHVLFFFLTSLWLVKYFQNRFPSRSLLSEFLKVFFIVLILGVSIEGLQMCSGDRSPDIFDVLRNQLGALIAFVCLYSRKDYRRMAFRWIVFILAGIVLVPLVRGGLDEWRARRQFPVLSDFETRYEVDRWESNGGIRIAEGIARNGNRALRVQLTTDKYSGISLKYFQGDWRAFTDLLFSVYLPADKSLKIFCRIHDSVHSNQYSDRFNQSFLLKKGWNDLVISLAEVKNGPRDRLLNLADVENFKIFVMEQEKERVIYLDSVYLE